MTTIVLRLRPQAARALRGGAQDPSATQLKGVLSRFRVDLRPQHSETDDPELQSYFTIPVETPERAGRLATALRDLDAVEAAYVQPAPEPT